MHLHTFRDEDGSRHFDLIGHDRSIDLVTVTAAGLLATFRRKIDVLERVVEGVRQRKSRRR